MTKRQGKLNSRRAAEDAELSPREYFFADVEFKEFPPSTLWSPIYSQLMHSALNSVLSAALREYKNLCARIIISV